MAVAQENESERVELLRSAPGNKWIALSADETKIVAMGDTFLEADEIARKSGAANFILTRTPDDWMPRDLPAIR